MIRQPILWRFVFSKISGVGGNQNLEARGCLRREYQLENRKTAHLRLCDPAQPIIAAGRSAQEQFGAALLDGFTPEELEHMQRSMERIRKNVEKYLEDKNNDNVD